MNAIDDLQYWRERAVQEQEAARSAHCSTARQCHRQLAAKYEARAMQLAITLHLGGWDASTIWVTRQAARTSG